MPKDASTMRADIQFIITLAVAVGAIAVTLLGWTSRNAGYVCVVITIALIVYAGLYSRISDKNRLKIATHWIASRLSGYTFALVLLAAAFLLNWWDQRPTGFDPKWPDAIVCNMLEPEALNSTQLTPTTFLFRGVADRGRYGTVAMYFFPGWANREMPKNQGEPQFGYVTHELWFRESDGELKRPTKDASGEALFEALYRISFPTGTYLENGKTIEGVDCGDENIFKFPKGHAFRFARSIK